MDGFLAVKKEGTGTMVKKEGLSRVSLGVKKWKVDTKKIEVEMFDGMALVKLRKRWIRRYKL